jgi:hypothetical protein
MDDRPATPNHPAATPSASRSGLTSAGLFRSGLTARLHTSQGGRSGAPLTSRAGQQDVPGQVHLYQPFQRPATAEQRHLTESVNRQRNEGLDESYRAQDDTWCSPSNRIR